MARDEAVLCPGRVPDAGCLALGAASALPATPPTIVSPAGRGCWALAESAGPSQAAITTIVKIVGLEEDVVAADPTIFEQCGSFLVPGIWFLCMFQP